MPFRAGIDQLRGTGTPAVQPKSPFILSFLNTPTSSILASHHALRDQPPSPTASACINDTDPGSSTGQHGSSNSQGVDEGGAQNQQLNSGTAASTGTGDGPGARATLRVKPLDDEQAFEIGADLVSELVVMSIMVSLVTFGIKIRRWKAGEVAKIQNEKMAEVLNRIVELEMKMNKLGLTITELCPKKDGSLSFI
eukprot:GHVN01104070.1.p1 GENE.GHVN01104070.1~~GHVN01104070.1.p1  ORF type:complete len:195 (+),score=47.26 GHVN01104070.1:235-819(+)